MTPAHLMHARTRAAQVLQAIAAGKTTIALLHAEFPHETLCALRTAVTFLRNRHHVRTLRRALGGSAAIYGLVTPLETALDDIMPSRPAPDVSALEQAMPVPACIAATLAAQGRSRIIYGTCRID